MAVSKEYYKNVSVENLVQDEFFIESILLPSPDSEMFWKEFLVAYPNQGETVQQAGSLIKNLKFNVDKPNAGAKERIWKNVLNHQDQPAKVISIHRKKRWMWAAAAIAGIAIVSIMWLFTKDTSKISFSSSYAEIRQVVLPDQSVVTLNAHSSLEYKKDWKEGNPREVWLSGEGFFEVKHLNQDEKNLKESEKFIVHVGEMSVEVLGTSFNVNDRNSITKVVLQTGKVRIGFKSPEKESVLMEPGDIVKFDIESKQVVKERTDTSSQLLWKKRQILLDKTSVKDLISTLENNFGYRVEVENEAILNRQISGTGTISLEDEQTFLKSLEAILNVDIIKKNNTLHIKNK